MKRYIVIGYYDPARGGSYTRLEEAFPKDTQPGDQNRQFYLASEVDALLLEKEREMAAWKRLYKSATESLQMYQQIDQSGRPAGTSSETAKP